MNPMNQEENEKIVWDIKLFWKVSRWILGTLVFLFLFFMALGYFGPKFDEYLAKKVWEKQKLENEAENARLEALEKIDIYGGKTPEETLELYIEALKKGDIELASKYSQVDQQESEVESLKKVLSRDGNLNYVISFTSDIRKLGKKTCGDEGCTFQQEYVVKEDVFSNIKETNNTLTTQKGYIEYRSISLKKNIYTNVWKIVEP